MSLRRQGPEGQRALDLRDVTLVGSDTGGALVQFVLDIDPSRIGRVVLTNCDAFDTLPPFPISAIFRFLRGVHRMKFNLQQTRIRAFRHSALGFGLLATDLDPALTRSLIEPALSQREIRVRTRARCPGSMPPDPSPAAAHSSDHVGGRESSIGPSEVRHPAHWYVCANY